jgi:high-affinity nickel-transport protein
MAGIDQLAALYRDRAQLPFRTRLSATFGAVAALHWAAVALLFGGTAAGGEPLAIGLVLTAYLAGVKHSYDWDHLAAIDNATRKFVAEHKDPVSVGFAFSLGHSSVVVLAGMLLVAGVSLIGSVAGRGFVARLLRRPLARVERPRHIFLIGFLFGLGFDTATTIGLLIVATAASLAGVSPLALLALPLAFAAAMTLCDTVNGVVMMRMYRSALADPRRKLVFNAVVTGISAVSALFIATITFGCIVSAVGLRYPLTEWLAALNLGDAGLALVAVLLLSWGTASLRRRWASSRRGAGTAST